MPEPTPKPPETTRPAAQKPAKDDRLETYPTDGDKLKKQIPIARPLEPKSAVVVSKSYRVVELPPPPVVEPPVADEAKAVDAKPHDTLPDGLAAPAERPPETPIELDALQIRAPQRWTFLRRRVRMPPRWEQWLADPQRRNNVGLGASIAINIAIVALLASMMHSPTPAPRN